VESRRVSRRPGPRGSHRADVADRARVQLARNGNPTRHHRRSRPHGTFTATSHGRLRGERVRDHRAMRGCTGSTASARLCGLGPEFRRSARAPSHARARPVPLCLRQLSRPPAPGWVRRLRLLDEDGQLRVAGHKQGFYPTDSGAYCDRGPATYVEGASTNFLYISSGWADVYPAGLGCQWIDVTDVPDGNYRLRVHVNVSGVIAEDNQLPNEVEVPITIAGQQVSSVGPGGAAAFGR